MSEGTGRASGTRRTAFSASEETLGYGEGVSGGGGSVSTTGCERFFLSLRSSPLPSPVDSRGVAVDGRFGEGGLVVDFGGFGGGAGADGCDCDDGTSRSD